MDVRSKTVMSRISPPQQGVAGNRRWGRSGKAKSGAEDMSELNEQD